VIFRVFNFHWFRNPSEEGFYTVYGEFSSMSDFENYRKSAVVETIVSNLIPLTSTKPIFKHFQASIFEQG